MADPCVGYTSASILCIFCSASYLDYLRKKGIKEDVVVVERKKVRRARIKDLALVVNTGGYYRPDNDLR